VYFNVDLKFEFLLCSCYTHEKYSDNMKDFFYK
jgi:hypothetical protein